MLAESIGLTRTYLYAWPEKKIESNKIALFKDWVYRREQGEPIAYILGKKEFWSLTLRVTSSVLIPRIFLKQSYWWNTFYNIFRAEAKIHLLELGTGSRAISLAIAKERPLWKLTATDISVEALCVAKINAEEKALLI